VSGCGTREVTEQRTRAGQQIIQRLADEKSTVTVYGECRTVQKVRRERKDGWIGSSQLQKEMRVGPSVPAGRGRHQTRQCGWSPKGFGREQLLKRQHESCQVRVEKVKA
jgi:hypothetical protein